MTVDLVRGLHEDMEATVSVAGESARIQMSNGLRQGCVLAPTCSCCILIWSCCVGEQDVQALELSYCISEVESLLVRELGHQCHP